MKIYTKSGDKGSTSLYGGKRISKHDIRIEAYGTIDELNSHLGMLSSQLSFAPALQDKLEYIQKTLFNLGSELANDPDKPLPVPKVTSHHIDQLEKDIDTMTGQLEPLTTFILPSGSMAISCGHICRTVCRRAERRVVHLSQESEVSELAITYLNRLSDYFFVLSRYIAHLSHTDEVKWLPK